MNKHTISIRQGTIDDAGLIAQFNINMARETEGMDLDPEVISAGVKTLIQNPELGFYLVAESNNTIVGSLMVTTEWSDWRNGMMEGHGEESWPDGDRYIGAFRANMRNGHGKMIYDDGDVEEGEWKDDDFVEG